MPPIEVVQVSTNNQNGRLHRSKTYVLAIAGFLLALLLFYQGSTRLLTDLDIEPIILIFFTKVSRPFSIIGPSRLTSHQGRHSKIILKKCIIMVN